MHVLGQLTFGTLLASPRVRLERLEDIEEVARPLPRDLMRGPRTRRRRNRIVA